MKCPVCGGHMGQEPAPKDIFWAVDGHHIEIGGKTRLRCSKCGWIDLGDIPLDKKKQFLANHRAWWTKYQQERTDGASVNR